MKFSFVAAAALFFSSSLLLPAAPAEPEKPAVAVPPLHFQHETLPNGLQVYSVEDNSTPNVAVQVWYHVGSKDDPKDRSGFAHLFEHMMFKGNDHLKPDTIDELTENVGGENNAYTADDVTVY
ncbi:MAG TPA: insulinase family protein, partial [Chthoniobacterales bacterium]|nr:insulinase family protein [Chthoniobacterales bacterium]